MRKPKPKVEDFAIVLKSDGKTEEQFMQELANFAYNRPYQKGKKIIWGNKEYGVE